MNLDAEEKRKQDILKKLLEGPQKWDPTTLDEEDLQKMKMGPSSYGTINTDPKYKMAQDEVLSRYGDIADKGYTAQEEAAMQRLRSEANRDDASRRASVLQQMQMRGGGGGGAELAAQLSSSDAAAERESQGALDAAARGQQRSLDALRSRGSLASQMADDDYQQKARAAEASDQISRFNSGLTQNFLQNRANAKNQAGQFNAGQGNQWDWNANELNYNDAVQAENRKIIEDQARKEQKRKKQSGMLGAAGAVAGGIIGTTIAPGLGTAAGASIGQSVGSGLGDIYSDEKLKEKVEPLHDSDIDDFLSSLVPKKFDYKKSFQDANKAELTGDLEARKVIRDGLKHGASRIGDEFKKTSDAHHEAERRAFDMENDLRMNAIHTIKGGAKKVMGYFRDEDSNPHDKDDQAQVGVIAQDMERSPIGAKVVKDTPNGKVLDDTNLLGAILASLKRLDDKKRDK